MSSRERVRTLRGSTEPGPEGFAWRGIEFSPVDGQPRAWASITTEFDDRRADWRLERNVAGGSWHARLRIGGDRWPGVGKTACEALDAAEAEAANVATYIVAMLPAVQSSKRPQARKVRRG